MIQDRSMLPRSIDAAKINRCLLCSLFEEIFLLYFFRDTRTGKYWLLKKIIPNYKKKFHCRVHISTEIYHDTGIFSEKFR